MISKTDIRNIIHQLIRVSLPNEKLNRPEELKFLSPIDNVSKGSTSLHEPAFSFIIGKETPKDSKTTFSDIMTLITSEALYPFYMELPPDEFIERLNKTIYEFVSEELKADRQRNVPDEDNVWIIPNSAFVNWFQENWIDIESIESFNSSDDTNEGLISFLPKWGKEVVRLLLENGEMKHQDILLSFKDLPESYNHISKIFKNRYAKEFFDNEIVNDNSYYSLRDPTQFKK